MSIKRQNRFYSQERINTPSLRAIESAVAADFDSVLRNFMSSTTEAYVVKGFFINIGATTFASSADNLTLNTLNGVVMNTLALEAGTLLSVDGSAAEALNSSNARVSGAFIAGSANYVSINYIRKASTSTDTVFFYDADSDTEFSKILPVSTELDYQIIINTTGFSGYDPLAIVTTNSSNVPTQIVDSRNMFFRLGTGGLTPDPFNDYSWPGTRTEPGTTTTSSSDDPFEGADKDIATFKEWADAVMTEIKAIKGTSFWFSNSGSSGGGSGDLSLATINDDANLSLWSGLGTLTHNLATTGTLISSADIVIRNVVTDSKFTVQSFSKSISDGSVLFLNLTRYTDVTGDVTVAPSGTLPGALVGLNTRTIQAGSVGQFSSLVSGISVTGDYVKVKSDNVRYFRQVQAFYDAVGSVTASASASYLLLDSAYAGATGVERIHYNKGFYSSSDVLTATKSGVLATYDIGNVYWLADRESDSIYVKNMGRFVPGEVRPVSENTSDNVLNFIGSSNESATFPTYATDVSGGITAPTQANYSGTSTDNLTIRASELSSAMANKAQDKNITFIGGGTVDNTAGLVAWNATITISVGGPGVGVTNYIAAGNCYLTATDSCAYVTVNRNSVAALPVSVTTFALLPLNENAFVFARKLSTGDVWVGNSPYLITDGTNSLSGITPSSAGATGGGNLHLWSQEIPTGSINSANLSFTITNYPYSVTTIMLFRNGLYQNNGVDYSVTNGVNILFAAAPLTGDEIVATYALGGTVPYVYVQSITTISITTTSIAFTPSPTASYTPGVAVFVNGLQRIANTDFTASGSGLGFAFDLEPGTVVNSFYTGVNANTIARQGQFTQALSNTRSYYSWFTDMLSENSILVSYDGVMQFSINNLVNATSLTINDFAWKNPNVIETNNASFTFGTLGYIWSH